MSAIEFKKYRDFGQVINDTFTFMRQNFKPLLKTYFVFCGIFVLAGMLSMLMQQYKMVNLVNNVGNGKNTNGIGSLYGVEYFLSLFFSLLSYSSMTVAILSYITLYVQKDKQIPTLDEVWAYFKYYFLRVFFGSLGLTLLAGIGFLFCLIPGFYLLPFVSITFPIMVIENATLGYSFDRSFKLVKGNFWTTFGTLVVMWIIVYACMSMIVLPTTLFSMIGMFTQGNPHMSLTLTMITSILQSICQVFTIIPVITISLLYFSLMEQKESTGLMERIAHFGTQEKPEDTRPEEY